MSQIKSQSTSGLNAINLACGGKLCRLPGWTNADHNPSTAEVMKVNLLKRLPFQDNTFDIVYHSQFIEHLPLDLGTDFLKECYRVLKPNGVLRVVTPDLRDQAAEYLKVLEEVLSSPVDKTAKLRYDWIRLEMLDQLTRQESGGEMTSFLSKYGVESQEYLRERLGRSGIWMIPSSDNLSALGLIRSAKKMLCGLRDSFKHLANVLIPESYLIGNFRLSGEVHLCMYDEYLLSSILSDCGFTDVKCLSAKESHIENWSGTLLDSDEHGNLDCPASLFMEAVKLPKKSIS